MANSTTNATTDNPDDSGARNDADLSTAELQAQIATLRKDISDLTATVRRYGRAQGEAFKAQATAGLNSAREAGSEKLSEAELFAQKKFAEGEEYVRTHPASSLGIAAAIGFVFGLLTARR